MVKNDRRKLKIFYCYASEDEPLQIELEKHLATLKRLKRITTRFRRKISPGVEWRHEINKELDTADIILLLVSSDFINSEYCYGEEMQQALARHRAGKARVIPVILRPVDFQGTPIEMLQSLPKEGKPVTWWRDRDEAFKNIAREIRAIVDTLRDQNTNEQSIDESNVYIGDLTLDEIPTLQIKRSRKVINGKTEQQWLYEGNAYYNARMYQEALLAFEKAILLDTENDAAYCLKANSLRKLGRNPEAIIAYKQAIYLDPTVSAYYHNMALSLWSLRDDDEALKAFSQAISLSPDDAISYKSKAALLLALKRYKKLLLVYDQVINLEPDNATTYRDKANILRQLQRYKELVPVYEQLIRLQPNNPVNYLNKAKALFYTENYYEMLIAYFSWCRMWIKAELIKFNKRFIK